MAVAIWRTVFFFGLFTESVLASCAGFTVTDGGTPGVGGCYRRDVDMYSSPSFKLNATLALYRWQGVWRLGTLKDGAGDVVLYKAREASDLPPIGDSLQWVAVMGLHPVPAVGSDCRGFLAVGAGTASLDGCYEQNGKTSDNAPVYQSNDRWALYRWDGVWRFGEMGVSTQYQALSASDMPPQADLAQWKATEGEAPPPRIVDFSAPPAPPTPPPPMRLVLHDDFDGAGLNESLWNVLEQVHRGGVYTRDNVYVENGHLVLRTVARNMTVNGRDFYVSSGAVNTSNKFAQRLGRWEARIRLPDVYYSTGYTLHSSVWLFSPGQQGNSGCSQEIDILEQYMKGGPSQSIVQANVHPYVGGFGAPCKKVQGGHVFAGVTGDHTSDWHTFALEWTEDKLTVFRDGVLVGAFAGEEQMQAMTDPQYFLLTACVVNRVPVQPENVLPQFYYIDYVKVWQYEHVGSESLV